MKIIIAGGRDYKMTWDDWAYLDRFLGTITEVVSGKARGADSAGEAWAEARGIPVKPFPADWDDMTVTPCRPRRRPDGSEYNAAAGHARNQAMADYADGVILFPGGRGTADMWARARFAGLQIWDRRTNGT